MNKWIRKGDKVVAISGNEKGQTGKVLSLSRKKNRLVIEGLNVRKKHVKPKSRVQPGVVEIEGSMHISNVSLCNDDGKAVKIKMKQSKDGSKQLIYLKDGKEVVYRDLKKAKKS